jgi:exonuclease III
MQKNKLANIEPIKTSPTWRNGRSREEVVVKRLDIFLVSEDLMETIVQVRASVTEWGNSDHCPISLQIHFDYVSPPIPLKINKIWLVE